ncbi:MAG: PHP domain-containing protein [Verrucomicrobiales bacterium]
MQQASHPFSALVLCAISLSVLPMVAVAEDQWFKGNTHTHSLWSDGNDFPEMIADWYKQRGYHFLVLSDHNTLSRGERWMKVADIERRKRGLGQSILGKYVARFGNDWVELRKGSSGHEEVRLRALDELRPILDEDGKFLMIEGEEITDKFEKLQVHINAINLAEPIKPQHGESLRDTMRNNLLAVREQAERLKKPIFAHLNHPNFQWSITAEDIAHVLEERFFEVYNGHPGINHLGSEQRGRPGDEKIWDIANTLRRSELGGELLLGVATDDSHTYHGGDVKPGRGWIMVRAGALEADTLVRAIQAGNFYASTGVTLESVKFDPESNVLEIEIAGDDGADGKVTTRIIGTMRGEEDDPAKVGKQLASYNTRKIRHQLSGDEWFIRATITSDKPHPLPSYPDQMIQAWTQPVVPTAK